MKLSTKIRKSVSCSFCGCGNTEIIMETIVFMVDGKREYNGFRLETCDLNTANAYHNYITKESGCTFLPQESFILNGNNEIILHYTSTTYAEWCNL